MAKRNSNNAPPANYGIRLTAMMVGLSWVGLQAGFLGVGFYVRKVMDGALLLWGSAVLLVGYSLILKLRLKRRDATPTREQAQLFYGGMLVLLLVLTFFLRLIVYHRWLVVGAPIWLGSVMITAIYMLAFIVMMKTDVFYYERSPREAWSRRLMKRLRLPRRWTE